MAKSLAALTDPRDLLRLYSNLFLQGRDLDITDESVPTEGESAGIFISRLNLFCDAVDEISSLENVRLPLEVTFHGEAAVDLGGPRREFFHSFMEEVKHRLLHVNAGAIEVLLQEEALARHHYFYAGLVIGLSVLQGGPLLGGLPNIIDGCTEAHSQLRRGLERTGVLQLIEQTNVKYLFTNGTNGTNTLNVSRLMQMVHVDFSEPGSNARIKEEKSVQHFVKYLREVYGKI
ncbi:uncharacterized protein LOC134269002 [Saccostrea cucullata]|uniref:uncharacterized protein LOC134269002 n=1 Tax=Saccostrea cuccullata TaxID=36930 RepID=UPI002ED20D61